MGLDGNLRSRKIENPRSSLWPKAQLSSDRIPAKLVLLTITEELRLCAQAFSSTWLDFKAGFVIDRRLPFKTMLVATSATAGIDNKCKSTMGTNPRHPTP